MKATMHINPHFKIDKIDDRIYGAFVEHQGRTVYDGIYEPGHPLADDMGFRTDVLKLVKDMNIPIIRYPGGNFVSNYNWEDGVGPKELRPRIAEAAWQSAETNEIGTDEFHEWAKRVGSSVMMAVNLGTKGQEEARNLFEYCNFKAGTKYADMRVKNGIEEPYNDRLWCLGNEMDGEWQIGHRTPEDYADIARKTALMLKRLDPTVELVACGSACYYMPTFGKWEAAVLEAAYHNIEYISLHQYYIDEGGDTATYLGATEDMHRFIKRVAATCDYVKGIKRTDKVINLSFDEWNVWSTNRCCDNEDKLWEAAPPREEYIYSMENALVFGGMLITLLKNCDRVKIACLAQLVNVAAPIMTVHGGPSWVQPTYYPFVYTSKYGRGTALQPVVECGSYHTDKYGGIPYIDAVAILSDDASELTVFALNRSQDEACELSVDMRDFAGFEPVEHVVMEHEDIFAVNSAENPDNVKPRSNGVTRIEDGMAAIALNKLSWNMIRFEKR